MTMVSMMTMVRAMAMVGAITMRTTDESFVSAHKFDRQGEFFGPTSCFAILTVRCLV